MRRVYQLFWLPFYRRWALWYIRRERPAQLRGLQLRVPAGVFHPGVFFSTPVMLDFLAKPNLQGRAVVDVGCGSGALGLFCATRGAAVTALDLNPAAVIATRDNALRNPPGNGGSFDVLESDLFDAVPPHALFDIAVINPPYYPVAPKDLTEHAFFAGPEWQYFHRLFGQLPGRLHRHGVVWMILSEDCALDTIGYIAAEHGFSQEIAFSRKKWGERFFILVFKFLTQPN